MLLAESLRSFIPLVFAGVPSGGESSGTVTQYECFTKVPVAVTHLIREEGSFLNVGLCTFLRFSQM